LKQIDATHYCGEVLSCVKCLDTRSPRTHAHCCALPMSTRVGVARVVSSFRFACFPPSLASLSFVFGISVRVRVGVRCGVVFRSPPLRRVSRRVQTGEPALRGGLLRCASRLIFHTFLSLWGIRERSRRVREARATDFHCVATTRYTTLCWRRIRFSATRNTLALSSLLPPKLTMETSLSIRSRISFPRQLRFNDFSVSSIREHNLQHAQRRPLILTSLSFFSARTCTSQAPSLSSWRGSDGRGREAGSSRYRLLDEPLSCATRCFRLLASPVGGTA
jgi:hypothetical protein